MANESNLKSNSERTPSERRENAKKAGIKSGEVRREKKLLKDLLEESLSKETKSGNYYVDITVSLIKQAKKGNVRAYEMIRDTLGQKPNDKVEISGEINNPFAGLTTEELREIVNEH